MFIQELHLHLQDGMTVHSLCIMLKKYENCKLFLLKSFLNKQVSLKTHNL